jgi:hypothetical protein
MSKPADSVSSRILYIKAGPDHGTAGHDQAGQDMVPVGPKAASHDFSPILYIEAIPDHGTAGHDQAGQDMVLVGPKAASHDFSRLFLSPLLLRVSWS